MCDDEIQLEQVHGGGMTRRGFGLAAAAAAALPATALAADVMEMDVEVKTPDGVADSVLFHPMGKGPWPAVLIWTDIMGLRPAFRDIGKRLAAEGYVVLVPNPFYRSWRGPVTDRAKAMAARGAFTPAGTEADAKAFIGYLDAQSVTDKAKPVGVHGYCMGGPLTLRTAAALPQRVKAQASFHPAGLVSDSPDSVHLLIPKMSGDHAFHAISEDDDQKQPDAKDVLKAAFAKANVTAKVEVYRAKHGFAVAGNAVYDQAEAERGWAELLALYKRALV